MAKPSQCEHDFKLIKSYNTLMVWYCSKCFAGPTWCIYECEKCKMKTCWNCKQKA
jgi:hypothetical protein